MARAKRHYIPGHVWHITHCCYKREFLLKFAKDRPRLLANVFRLNSRQKKVEVYTVSSRQFAELETQTNELNHSGKASLGYVACSIRNRWSESPEYAEPLFPRVTLFPMKFS